MTGEHRRLDTINRELIECRRCPRLVAWREQVAREKRASFSDEEYWGRPVPGFGDPDAAMLIVGLAPAAHGANRTGRMFTGDRSGDWLFRSLHRVGLANRPDSVSVDDGLELANCYVTSSVHCAPPANKPTSEERATCAEWLSSEMQSFRHLRVIVALGGIGYREVLRTAADHGWEVPTPRPKFGHGVELSLSPDLTLLASYHPSQQNTFTGRLTEVMLDTVLARGVELAAS